MPITVWILGDQLLPNHPALDLAIRQAGRDGICILMVESQARARRLPYQRKKLVLLISAMRHYAQDLRKAGYQVDYRRDLTTIDAILDHIKTFQPQGLITMVASEHRGRSFQFALEEKLNLPVTMLPNTQLLCGRYDPYPDPRPEKRLVQENFYRRMRIHFDLLMESDGEPVGGEWNYDHLNRRRLPKGVQPPDRLRFEPDSLTREVMDEVAGWQTGLGSSAGFDLAVTHEQAQQAARDFFDNRLPDFGIYEDAMSSVHGTLYHSRLSPYLNLGLLDPLELTAEAERCYQSGKAPINSVEGFTRQVIGWREFIYWQYWRLAPDYREKNYWSADRPLPSFFWDGQTDLNCLGKVIRRALQVGYTHHIERLMVVCNFCLLAGFKPAEVNDWFLSAYIDAYEWVMLPNVIGMGLYADGGMIATKPYIASANYINKMSDYCRDCLFDHKDRKSEAACPFNFLYWNFILQHETALRKNPRMNLSLLGLRHLDPADRLRIQQLAKSYLLTLT